MSIKVQCGQCSKRYAAPDKLAGQRVKCPECGAVVTVPAAAAQPAKQTRPENRAADLLSEEFGDDTGLPFSEAGPSATASAARPPRQSPQPPQGLPKKAPQRRPTKGAGKSRSKSQTSGQTWAILGAIAAVAVGLVLVGVLMPPLLLLMIPILLMVGGLLSFAGSIWGLVVAFSEDVICGVLCLFVPFYWFYYAVTRWDEMRRPFFTWLAGFVLAFVGPVLTMGGLVAAVAASGPEVSSRWPGPRPGPGENSPQAGWPGPDVPPGPPDPYAPTPPEPGGPGTGDLPPEGGQPGNADAQPPSEPTEQPGPGPTEQPGPGPGEKPGPDQGPQLPEKIADWKEEDYLSARTRGDSRLVEAVGYLGQQSVGKASAVQTLAQLLVPPKPAEEPQEGPQSPYRPPAYQQDARLVEAIVGALGINGTPAARAILVKLLAGALSVGDDRTTVDAVLKALVNNPCPENDQILFGVLTAAEKLRANAEGKVTAGDLRQMTLAAVSTGASEAFRTKLAQLLVQPSTPPDLRSQMGEFLSQNHPDNVGAQLIFYQSNAPEETKAALEQYFTAYSSAAMAQVLGIPETQAGTPGAAPGQGPFGPGGNRGNTNWGQPGGRGFDGMTFNRPNAGRPNPGGTGPGWPGAGPGQTPQVDAKPADPDAPYRRARQLWSARTVAMVEKRLAEVKSLQDQAAIVMLAGTMPADSTRSALWAVLYGRREDGPQGLESAGLATNVISDPGMLLTIKMLPRRELTDSSSSPGGTPGGSYRPANPSRPGGTQLPGASRPRDNRYRPATRPQPGGSPSTTSPAETARDALQRQMQAEEDWMKTSQALVWAWFNRFDAAALAGTGNRSGPVQAGSASGLPIKLHRDARVAAEYHLKWPSDLGAKLSGIAPGPMEIHYIRIEEKADPIKRVGFYRRPLDLKQDEVRSVEKGYWLDRVRRVPKSKEKTWIDKTNWRCSVDILITLATEDPQQLPRGQETDLIIQILSVEMKNPATS